jgi:hypothetical protein
MGEDYGRSRAVQAFLALKCLETTVTLSRPALICARMPVALSH